MKKLCALALTLLLVSVFALGEELDLFAAPMPEGAQTISVSDSMPDLSQAPLLESPPISLNCAAALLVEAQSGQILFEMNADQPRPAASITKVMTILLSLEAIESGRISREQIAVVSENAAGMGGSQVLLDVGESQSVDVLLKSAIVGSANDASVALAELMFGSEALCVEKMNARAAALGMKNTHFVNCTGLPAANQHTSARDVARMTMAMLRHDLYYDYSGIWLDEVDHGDGRITQLTNTNKLIRLYDGCDGGKTGSTKEAGYCISATAKRGDMRLIAVVLGAGSGADRFDIASDMLDYGFANYRLYPVAQKGTKIKGQLPVNGGRPDAVRLILEDDLTLLLPKGSEQEIQLIPCLPDSVDAPVEIGRQIGTVQVVLDGRVLADLNVCAASASEINGWRSSLRRIFGLWAMA